MSDVPPAAFLAPFGALGAHRLTNSASARTPIAVQAADRERIQLMSISSTAATRHTVHEARTGSPGTA